MLLRGIADPPFHRGAASRRGKDVRPGSSRRKIAAFAWPVGLDFDSGTHVAISKLNRPSRTPAAVSEGWMMPPAATVSHAATHLKVLSAGAVKYVITDVAGSRTELGRTLTGICVHAGAPMPDISTPESFKQTMLRVRSVAYTNPQAG